MDWLWYGLMFIIAGVAGLTGSFLGYRDGWADGRQSMRQETWKKAQHHPND